MHGIIYLNVKPPKIQSEDNSMARNINKERFFGNMEDLKQESHVGSGDGYENMTAEERRRAQQEAEEEWTRGRLSFLAAFVF